VDDSEPRHYCFIQGEVIGFHVLMGSLHPRSTRASWWSPPVLQREAVKILASVSSGAFAQCFVLFWFHLELPSWILDLDRTHWALAFVCFSFVFLYILCFGHKCQIKLTALSCSSTLNSRMVSYRNVAEMPRVDNSRKVPFLKELNENSFDDLIESLSTYRAVLYCSLFIC